jgi:hypothetical protein
MNAKRGASVCPSPFLLNEGSFGKQHKPNWGSYRVSWTHGLLICIQFGAYMSAGPPGDLKLCLKHLSARWMRRRLECDARQSGCSLHSVTSQTAASFKVTAAWTSRLPMFWGLCTRMCTAPGLATASVVSASNYGRSAFRKHPLSEQFGSAVSNWHSELQLLSLCGCRGSEC